MKKFLIAAVASMAVMTGAAQAQDWTSQTYGKDFNAWWLLNAPVDVFCKLNTKPGVNVETNADIVNGANGKGGTIAEADGTVTFDLDHDPTNTVQQVRAEMNFPYSQCNTRWTLKLNSQNGGLKNPKTTSDDDFVKNPLEYNVAINFDGKSGGALVKTAGDISIPPLTNIEPKAGNFMFAVSVPAMPKLLVEGTYSDFLKVIVAPAV